MKHDERFPIEPLSPESWRDIEQRLFVPTEVERRRALATVAARPRQPAIWYALPAAAALLVALYATRSPRREDPPPTTARHVVASELSLETQLGDATLALSPGSSALLHEQGARGALVVLERGDVHCSVPPRNGRAPFTVQAGGVRVEVVGTRFRVSRSGPRVQVVDEEGRVRVLSGAESTLLSPGMRWSNDAPAPERPGQTEALAPEAEPERTRQSERTKRPGAKALTEDQARERFEQAARLEVSNPEQALRGYAVLAAARGAWAETALYAMGRLALERGDHERATPLLHSYLRRYPRGANAPDVRHLLEQLGVPSDEGPKR